MVMISYETRGGERAMQRLLGIAQRIEDPRPAFREVVQDMRETSERQFETRGRRSGRPWRALATATVLAKNRGVSSGRGILELTLGLRRSLTRKTARYALGRVTRKGILYGTRHPVVRFHQAGTVKMPARELLVVTKRDSERWTQVVKRHVLA